jgi:hypothetical protein
MQANACCVALACVLSCANPSLLRLHPLQVWGNAAKHQELGMFEIRLSRAV